MSEKSEKVEEVWPVKKTRNKPTHQDGSLNIRMKSSILDEFKEICQNQGLIYSKVVRSLIADYVDKYKKKQKSKIKTFKASLYMF